MFSWLLRTASVCWVPVRRTSKDEEDDGDGGDDLLWSRDIERHSVGEFSIALVQANECVEDYSQVKTGPGGTFVRVYDGHGRPDAARYITDHLFPNLMIIYNGSQARNDQRIFWENPFIGVAIAAGYHQYILWAVAIKALRSFRSNA